MPKHILSKSSICAIINLLLFLIYIKVLRRTIKEYEISFETQNCRKVQRDDKKCLEEDYVRYKALKARIKLLNALINKQKSTA